MVALKYGMSAILTKNKIKDNYFRNFSQSAFFQETKLTETVKASKVFITIFFCYV